VTDGAEGGGREPLVELRLAQAFLEAHPEEGAALLEQGAPADAAGVLALCDAPCAAAVLRRMRSLAAADCLVRLDPAQAVAFAQALPPADGARILRALAPEARETLLGALAPAARAALAALLRFPEGSAGALMDPRVATLPRDLRVLEAVERLRAEPAYGAYYLYVVDREQRLVGVLNYRDLVRAEPQAELTEVMRPAVASVHALARGAELAAHPGWRGFLALPVVDEEGVLLGALRYETLARPAQSTGARPDPAAPAPQRAPGLLRRLLGRRRRGEEGGSAT
jgi:magnesium transporter